MTTDIFTKATKIDHNIDRRPILLYNGTRSYGRSQLVKEPYCEDDPHRRRMSFSAFCHRKRHVGLVDEMIATIPLRQIDIQERKFCLSYPLLDEKLLASIEQLGIIEPLVLLEPSPFFVVTGFKRLEAAKRLGLKDVPAVTAKLSEKEGLLFAIHDNVHRGLNVVEKAHVLEKMVQGGFYQTEIDEIMALFSLSPHKKVLTNLLAIASSEKLLKDFIIEQGLSFKNIEYLLWFERGERNKIMRTLASMHLTESYIREILEMLHLMKIKKGRFDSSMLRNTKNIHELRDRLKKKVHPGLSSLENKLAKIRKASALPPAIDIKVDPFFEKEYIDIIIRAKSQEETKELLGKLDEVLQNGHIRSILELIKGRVR